MGPRERLDFIDDSGDDVDARSARLGRLLSTLSQPGSSPTSPQRSPQPPVLVSETDALPSFPGPIPPSSALARARAFLPLLAQSNAELLSRAAADPSSVAIEITGDGESSGQATDGGASGQYIAMDLGLGVFDVPGANSGPQRTGDPALGPDVDVDADLLARLSRHAEEDDDEEDAEIEDEAFMTVRQERRREDIVADNEEDDGTSEDSEDSEDSDDSDETSDDDENSKR